MQMTKLASLFLTATLSLASGAALAADTGAQTNNGQANAAAEAGQVAPDAKQNVAPNNLDGTNINTGNTNTNTSGAQQSTGTSATQDGMSKDEVHKNTMCKDGRCPDVNKKVETGDGTSNNVDTKTDGTTQ
ncbi:YbgS-like family protein [Citrobacter sedlakii]|uniref:YbgS-like family protein n=1 Tax=Citrobacter TaxID=544 RepID=UPI001969B78E|nr:MULTISPECIES: YbgS-like family protein [Citrobacter]MBM9566033.1 YbgS-like family protein [Citrobacter sedlakii]HBL4691046.1 YbgS-like family protein [Citrobacter sedlakii]HBL4705956.1 YbgS-like family protein [Citrobacter sedlakii]HBL4720234.1 YbgS-like family protein [Citrobacter sedlakii]HCA7841185.1 YbgS-like family protein [Citrobacter sedlakii]